MEKVSAEDVARAREWLTKKDWEVFLTGHVGASGQLLLDMLADHAAAERAGFVEEACKVINVRLQSAAIARDRAQAAGRVGVADCRQSDVETCERIIAVLRTHFTGKG